MTTVPTTLMPANTLTMLPHADCDEARRLLASALEADALTPARMRAALEPGWGLARWGGDPAHWPVTSGLEKDAAAVGRLLLKLRLKLGVPLEDLSGPSAKSVLRELLA
jgi:hypothetical protein